MASKPTTVISFRVSADTLARLETYYKKYEKKYRLRSRTDAAVCAIMQELDRCKIEAPADES